MSLNSCLTKDNLNVSHYNSIIIMVYWTLMEWLFIENYKICLNRKIYFWYYLSKYQLNIDNDAIDTFFRIIFNSSEIILPILLCHSYWVSSDFQMILTEENLLFEEHYDGCSANDLKKHAKCIKFEFLLLGSDIVNIFNALLLKLLFNVQV